MSDFNAYRNNLPPGCTDADGGASDVYICEDCEGEFSQDELDNEETDGETIICKECGERKRMARLEAGE